MKKSIQLLATLTCFALGVDAQAGTISKTNNADNLNLGSSWVGGTAPGSGDIAQWDSTVFAANTTLLGADLAWQGIKIVNPGGLVTINAGNTLTVSLADPAIAVDMTTATADLTLNCPVALGAKSAWDVASGRTLTVSGLISGGQLLGKFGSGTMILNNDANTFSKGTDAKGGVLIFTSVANVNSASALGRPTTPALGAMGIGVGTNIGTLRYEGSGDCATDRRLAMYGASGGGMVDASGSGTIQFLGGTVRSYYSDASSTKKFTLKGSNPNDNKITGIISDEAADKTTAVVKDGVGKWWLSGASTYSSTTTIKGGTLIIGGNAPAGAAGALGSTSSTVILGDAAGSAASLLTGGAFAVGRTVTVPSAAAGTIILGGATARTVHHLTGISASART